MDAVKFLREFKRMCKNHNCKDCPAWKLPFCFGDCKNLSQEKQERMVEIVENWSEENPEEIGKKYIIEIEKITYYGNYKIKGINHLLGREDLKKLEEYKESEE